MYTNLFREDMSYAEAQSTFFESITRDMSEEEIERIRADYAAMVSGIMAREFAATPAYRLTSHPL